MQEGINNTPSPRSRRVGPATEDYGEEKRMESKSACVALLNCLGKMVLCMILLGGKSSQSPTQENLEDQHLKRAKDRVEAYSELAVVTALVFGFAVTSFIEASDTANELSSSENGYRSKAAAAFSVVMCLVCLSTASSLMAVIGHNFVLKQLQVTAPSYIDLFIEASWLPCFLAIFCAVTAIPLFLLGLMLYAIAIYQRPDLCIIFVVILSCGMVLSCAASVGLVILYKYFEQEEKKF